MRARPQVSDAQLRSRMATLHPDDPINIQYTSGTTGSPKGATLSHRNILNNGYFVTELLELRPADRLCIPVPFYHCFGMVMGNLGCTSHGATMVIPGPGFDPAATLAAVSERCTALYGVPTMFIAMLGLPDFTDRDVSSLRTGIMAGATCPVEVMKRCIADLNMAEVSIAYGMTETSPVSCQTRIDDDLQRRTETVGRAHPHVEIKIIDLATGELMPRGQPGELCTRAYSVMLGYWRDHDRTREVIDSEGWMHTGDLAVMRDDGYCVIAGRIKHIVIRGGENVSPRDRRISAYPPRHRRCPGRRRSGREIWRGGLRVDQASTRWRTVGRRCRPGVLFRAARPLQDPSVRAARRRLPDDGHRQGAQGGHARRIDPATRLVKRYCDAAASAAS